MILNARAVFLFFGMNFQTKKIQPYARCLLLQFIFYPPLPPPFNPKFTMRSTIVTVEEGMETNKLTKTKIWVGYTVKAKIGYLENITREGRSRSMRKEVVGCVQNLVGNKKFLFQFEYGHNKGISSSLLVFLSLKEEVETDEPISHLIGK